MSETNFFSAVDAIFQNWTALQLTVSQGGAGIESADFAKWMVSATVQWFSENKDLEYDEVEDFLIDVINQEFNVQFNDGSVEEVSKLICEFYKLSTSPNCETEFKHRLQELPKCNLSECKVDQEELTKDEHIDCPNEVNSNGKEPLGPEADKQDTDESIIVKQKEHENEGTFATETLFYSAVNSILQNWTALQLMVSQGAGGPKSADIAKWMVSATVQWFSENKDLECYEVEDFLIDIINQEFNALIEDGSAKEVGKLVCEFYKLSASPECKAEFNRRFQELPKCDLSKCQVDQEPSIKENFEAKDDDEPKDSNENNGDGKEDKEPEPETQDSDGCTIAKRKKM